MPNIPTFIKPSRKNDPLPSLTPSLVNANLSNGIETSVVLDLNILNLMRDVIAKGISLEEANLVELVSFFNSTPVFITPGIAFGESDKKHVLDLSEHYERFISEYCPGYIDTPNCTHDHALRNRSRNYTELDEDEARTLLIMYVAMLAIQVISKENEKDTPEQKFATYLNFMAHEADMLSAIEAEVAIFWFFDRTKVKDEAFKNSCKIIRDNFSKGGKSVGRLQYSLNYARDLAYYRYTARQDGELLDGALQDTWLVTADQALIELAKSIYFHPKDGCSSKFTYMVRNSEQKTSPYWKHCDNLFFSLIEERRARTDTPLSEKSWQKLEECRDKLEQKILTYWPKDDEHINGAC